MSLLHWLMPWRREVRPDKPFTPVPEVDSTVQHSHAFQAAAHETVRTSINAIERQQRSGMRERLIRRADEIRALTNSTIDRTRGQ